MSSIYILSASAADDFLPIAVPTSSVADLQREFCQENHHHGQKLATIAPDDSLPIAVQKSSLAHQQLE
eukprot:3521128-Pyramimonas_sp.AAC.1